MERGLLWLPLLGAFIWLAWSGKNEYDKLETYRHWAEGFDRAKYDIYAVLGQKDKLLTWGKPTKKGIVDQKTFSLEQVQQVNLLVDEQVIDLAIDPEKLPNKGKHINLQFSFRDDSSVVKIPFTEVLMASQWGVFLRSQLS
jgi:hypothetical protein